MQEIIIDKEFADIFPPLNERNAAELEESILVHGCVLPLVLWDGILIDGHNRYQILMKHGLPFSTISVDFASRDLAKIWIIENQVARRNLTQSQLRYYRGSHYHLEKRVVGNMTGRNQHNEDLAQNGLIPQRQSTADKLAEQYNVSRNTIKRDAQLANAIDAIGDQSPDIKMDILSDKIRISRVQLQELASGSEECVSAVISQIENGTFTSRRSRASAGADDVIADANMKPWERQFATMTGEFQQTLRGFAKVDDTESVRSALRQYIDMLEDLYRGI